VDPYEITIAPEEAGQRLDRLLALRDPATSRATFQRWIEEGRVTVAGRPVSAKHKLTPGTVVRVAPAPPPASDALPEPIPLDVLFEDAHLIVLHKPAGLVVHPAAGHASGTLVNALLHHAAGLAESDDPRRPGVVHRLDKDTSGVMVVTRDEATRAGLSAQFAAHSIERLYEAICVGLPPERVSYETLIGRHPSDRKRFSSKVTRGKRAVTHVTRLRVLRGAALVQCRLETGRTHQIRVHLSHAGHPLLGDDVYGAGFKTKASRLKANARALLERLDRQALHAAHLTIEHPSTGEAMSFDADWPEDMAKLAQALRG
jgi:23S rRNA pseudouridine1911/1915/1917 synthase